MKKLICIFVLGLLLSSNAYAGIKVGTYLKVRENKNEKANQYIDDNIMGIGTGIFWSNISIQSKFGKVNGEKPMYCSPPKMSLTNENYINFLDEEIKYQKNLGIDNDKTDIGMMIILHMRRIFPCNKGN
ncbi:hypothetical protein OAR93_00920 [Pelagibacteraceae bacterium]|jgi:hypothetical protein|nr:hypothetical protein [Pelagibacteraceae bacterium]